MNIRPDTDNINVLTCEEIYRQLIHVLEYENSSFYRIDETGVYDACYYVEVEQTEYPIVGIKRMDIIDEDLIIKQHLLYWNHNDVPISVIILPGEYRIYNNFSRKKGKNLLYGSKNSNKNNNILLDDFKASRITTTVVWERLIELSGSSDRVDKQLLLNLKNTVVQVHTEYDMPLENAYNFMSQCIFVKYLEDRNMLTEKAFIKWNVDSFTKLLEKSDTKEIYEFFLFLKKRFNGDLFKIQKSELPSKTQLGIFYRFFRGDDILHYGYTQLRLFPYDFSVIPIGLISNIYETFFSMDDEWKNEKKAAGAGAFYTPHCLADFMVQQSFLQLTTESDIPCVLDPACGSGVFLVSSFKRQIEILKNKKSKLTADDMRLMMIEKIYGVDINASALRISCFSLYIALLDELTPKDITENDFQFPNLIGTNLIEGSFFSNIVDLQFYEKHFDIIVGNPPWKSIPKSDHVSYCKERKIPIADAQIAQAFVSRAQDFANEFTEVSFLITNAIFTNKNSKKYLAYLVNDFTIEKVINLEAVKAQLFVHASYPCSILVYRCVNKTNYDIVYYAFRSNVLFRLLHQFIYDKGEEIKISKHKLLNREYIWTILTYGDEFDVECMEYLREFPTLNECIKGKLDFVQGYITARNGKEWPEFSNYKGGSLKGCFSPYGLDYNNIPEVLPNVLYDRPRELQMYTCLNKVLIKRTYNEKFWGAAYISEPLIFSNDFSTFNDYQGEHTGMLRYLEGVLNSKVFRYYSFYMTKVKAAKKPEVVKEDILCFPLPIFDAENPRMKEFVENVIEMEKFVCNEWKLKQENPLLINENEKIELQQKLDKQVFQLYNLDKFQISVIEEGIERFETNKNKDSLATEQDYYLYSQYLCNYFNYYMKWDTDISWKVSTRVGDFYTEMYFFFDSDSNFINPDITGLAGLEKINGQLLVQKQIMVFEKEGFRIIQTRDKNNWKLCEAKKMAARMTRRIMGAGGKTYE